MNPKLPCVDGFAAGSEIGCSFDEAGTVAAIVEPTLYEKFKYMPLTGWEMDNPVAMKQMIDWFEANPDYMPKKVWIAGYNAFSDAIKSRIENYELEMMHDVLSKRTIEFNNVRIAELKQLLKT